MLKIQSRGLGIQSCLKYVWPTTQHLTLEIDMTGTRIDDRLLHSIIYVKLLVDDYGEKVGKPKTEREREQETNNK